MLQDSSDRRAMRRFDMRLPAAIRLTGNRADEFHTETQNVSARGLFFYLDRAVAHGSRIEVTLTFPPHVTLTDAVRVRLPRASFGWNRRCPRLASESLPRLRNMSSCGQVPGQSLPLRCSNNGKRVPELGDGMKIARHFSGGKESTAQSRPVGTAETDAKARFQFFFLFNSSTSCFRRE